MQKGEVEVDNTNHDNNPTEQERPEQLQQISSLGSSNNELPDAKRVRITPPLVENENEIKEEEDQTLKHEEEGEEADETYMPGAEDGSSDEEEDEDEMIDAAPAAFLQRANIWLQMQRDAGQAPTDVLNMFGISVDNLPGEEVGKLRSEEDMWGLVKEIMMEMAMSGPHGREKKREKLEDVNTLDDVVELLMKCKKIVVLTGAGVSVSCGIPDFRSVNGIYARLAVDFPTLPDPQSMFDINYFKRDPRPFFNFAKEIYPGNFLPSPSHYFIRLLETQGRLLRNYGQNIDTLEQVAGIERVINCHGSFATASCMVCRYQVDESVIKEEIFRQDIPMCPKCKENEALDEEEKSRAVMKPDIVFFHEPLPNTFHDTFDEDQNEADLLIVMGSSLKVQPVSSVPNLLPAHVPQILINREPLPHKNFDVELLGNCDEIVAYLLDKVKRRCEEKVVAARASQEVVDEREFDKNAWELSSQTKVADTSEIQPEFVEPCRYVFPGAVLDANFFSDDSDMSDVEDNMLSGEETQAVDSLHDASEVNEVDIREQGLSDIPDQDGDVVVATVADDQKEVTSDFPKVDELKENIPRPE
eukprot:Nk52_evm4s213 gene=Nk52_evmTU4s213